MEEINFSFPLEVILLRFSFRRVALAWLAGITLVIAPAVGWADTSPALDFHNLDTTVSPRVDFYRYAVGGWIARNPIPADRTGWGSFYEIEERTEHRLQELFQRPAQTDAPVGTERRKIADFYAACVDTDEIEARGTTALRPLLAEIDRLRSTSNLAPLLADVTTIAGPGFSFGSETDPRDARQVIAAIGQGGLTLPTRDYYLARDARSAFIRTTYFRYMTKTFRLLGDATPVAAREAADVMRIETRLARASRTPDALRDPFANYHPMRYAAISTLAPHFDWAAFAAKSGIPISHLHKTDVGQPEFVRAFDASISAEPTTAWQSYLRWQTISSATVATALPSRFRQARFDFNRVLYGAKKIAPRTRTCTNATSDALGFAVGSLYANEYFPPAARERARQEIALIKAQLHDDIATLPWMGPISRREALAKFAKLSTVKIGYPDHPRSYGRLRIDRGDALGNALRVARFDQARDLAKIGKRTDRSEWGLTPQTVNAYYDPSINEIVIPAAILQPPFFNAAADDAVNFGGIGAVIGHELTHGFDDEGSDYDGDGNLRRWLTRDDAARFHARVSCIISQASAYRVPSIGLHLNGKLVVGEATADIGGTTLAYRALREALAHGAPATTVDGFSPDQRFFLSWAQVWRSNDRPEAERAQVLGDPHPVSAYRVNGTLSDELAFARAFGVTPADPMFRPPTKRCAIW